MRQPKRASSCADRRAPIRSIHPSAIVRAAAEPLEARRLLSTITWTNRGSSSNDSDRFGAVFGNLANQARAVIDADLAYWARVIEDFKYSDGTNTFSVTISMNSAALTSPGNGVGANAFGGTTRGTNPAKPITSQVGIGWRSGITATTNSAAGWYLDPTPMDNSEFTTRSTGNLSNGTAQTSAFTGTPSTTVNGADLFTGVLHELGHAMGLSSNSTINAYATDTGVVDTINTPAASPNPAHLYRVDAGSSHTLWTAWDSGGATGGAANFNGAQHYAPFGTSVTQNNRTYTGTTALMNAYFTNRSIIDDGSAELLRVAYGYSVNAPSFFGTFYDRLDSNGTLTIQPPTGASNQTLTLATVGSTLDVTLTTGSPVAGADPTSIFSAFPLSSITKVVVDMGDGNDTVNIQSQTSSIPMSIDMGAGAGDLLFIYGSTAYDALTIDNANNGLGGRRIAATNINVTNLYNTESVTFYTSGGGVDAYLPNVTSIGTINITSNLTAENIAVHSLGSGSLLNVSGGNGSYNNVFTFDGGFMNAVGSEVNVYGNGGTDRLVLDDSSATVGRVFNIFNGEVAADQGFTRNVYWTSVQNLDLYTGSGADSVQVYAMDPATVFSYYAGENNDVLVLGYDDGHDGGTSWSADIPNTVNYYGQGGSGDDLIVDDTDLAAGATTVNYTLTNGLLKSGTHALNFDSLCEIFEFHARDYGNSIFNVVNYVPTQHLYLYGGASSPTADFLYIDDRTMAGGINYPASVEVYPTQIKRNFSYIPNQPNLIDYYNWTSPNYYGNTANTNTIYVYGVSNTIPSGYQMTILGGTVADNVRLYPHNSSGALTINANLGIGGDAGYDTLYVIDDNNPNGINYQFANTFGASTQNIYGLGTGGLGFGSDFEDLYMNSGEGNDTYAINSYLVPTRLFISGRGGDDTVDVALSTKNLATAIRNGLTMSFNGGQGNDRETFWNTSNASAWTYLRSNGFSQIDRNDGATGTSHFSLIPNDALVETLAIRAGAAVDTFGINAPTNQPMEIHGGGGLDSVNVTTGRATFTEAEDFSSLVVQDTAQAAITNPARIFIFTQQLIFLGTGTLDLNASDLIYDYASNSPRTTLQAAIARGRNGGTWTGTGITSSAALNNVKHNTTLGLLETTQYKSLYGSSALFDGVPTDTTAVLIRYTFYGDTDFNGKINADDYGRLDSGYQTQHNAGFVYDWFHGDFDYNGIVDANDYALIDAAYQTQGSTLLPSLNAPVVPPGAVTIRR